MSIHQRDAARLATHFLGPRCILGASAQALDLDATCWGRASSGDHLALANELGRKGWDLVDSPADGVIRFAPTGPVDQQGRPRLEELIPVLDASGASLLEHDDFLMLWPVAKVPQAALDMIRRMGLATATVTAAEVPSGRIMLVTNPSDIDRIRQDFQDAVADTDTDTD